MTPTGAPRPDGPGNVARGTIMTSAYLGAVTLYDVHTPAGTLIKVTAPNGTRSASPALPAGTEVWLHWAVDASVVLQG
jgi:spermidine/putrescine transport system ATP-binding protein